MSCQVCANTTLRIDRDAAPVVAGVITPGRSLVVTGITAYREPKGHVAADAQIKVARRRMLFVFEHLDYLPGDLITDLGDSNATYVAEDGGYNKFDDHIEVFCIEQRAS